MNAGDIEAEAETSIRGIFDDIRGMVTRDEQSDQPDYDSDDTPFINVR